MLERDVGDSYLVCQEYRASRVPKVEGTRPVERCSCLILLSLPTRHLTCTSHFSHRPFLPPCLTSFLTCTDKLAFNGPAPTLADVLEQLFHPLYLCCLPLLCLTLLLAQFDTFPLKANMAPTEPPDPSRLQQHDETNVVYNNGHPVNGGEPVFTNEAYFTFDEDEPPETPSAADAQVEETPTTRQARQVMEARTKAPQPAFTSNRLQGPSTQVDFMDDPDFSFLPFDQEIGGSQHRKLQSPHQTLLAEKEVEVQDKDESTSKPPTKTILASTVLSSIVVDTKLACRDPNECSSPEVDSIIDQLQGDTPGGNGNTVHGGAVMPQQRSCHTDSPAIQQQSNATEVPLPLHDHGEQFHGGNDALHDGNFCGHYDERNELDASTSLDQADQINVTPLPHDRQKGVQPRASSPIDQDVVDLTKSPAATEHAETKSYVDHSAMPSLAPIHESRVSKAQRRRRQRPDQNPQPHRHDDTVVVPQPSEEDLCFLLMSRAREHNEARRKLRFLEHENKRLRKEKYESDTELQQALDTRDDCSREYDLLNQNLDSFKEKYYKLKKWALETNKDCEILQEKASSLQRGLLDSAKDRNQLFAHLQDVKTSSSSASEQVEKLRDGLREVKLMAEERLASIDQLNIIITKQDDQLRSEQQISRKFELHIHHLEQERDRQNQRMHSEQQTLNESLKGVSEKLEALHNGRMEDNSEEGRIIASLNRVQAVIDNDLMTKADMVLLKGDLGSTATILIQIEQIIPEKLQAAMESLKNDLQRDVSTQATKLLSAVHSDNDQLVDAKADVARLEQKALYTGEMMNLLKEAKVAADENTASLQKVTDELTKQFGKDKAVAQTQINDFRDKFNNMLAKWQSACSSLETCKEERNEAQAEVNDVLNHLAEAIEEQNLLRSELNKAEELIIETQQQNEQERVERVRVMSHVLRPNLGANHRRWIAQVVNCLTYRMTLIRKSKNARIPKKSLKA